MYTWTVHHVLKCMSCYKAMVVITGRVHCFHDYIYIIYIIYCMVYNIVVICIICIIYSNISSLTFNWTASFSTTSKLVWHLNNLNLTVFFNYLQLASEKFPPHCSLLRLPLIWDLLQLLKTVSKIFISATSFEFISLANKLIASSKCKNL